LEQIVLMIREPDTPIHSYTLNRCSCKWVCWCYSKTCCSPQLWAWQSIPTTLTWW